MAGYFTYVPDLEYLNRNLEGVSSINKFIRTKNLFRRVKLRDDIFGNINFFDRYKVIGDERPDNVAVKLYGDETLDWVILLSNNILNIQSEWPLSQRSFDSYLTEKYGSGIDNLDDIYNIIFNGVHHFETIEVRDSSGVIQLKEGIIFTPISSGFSANPPFPNFRLQYTDPGETGSGTQSNIVLDGTNIFRAVTNYEYEIRLEEAKRNIFVLKPRYLNIIINDIETTLPYTEGSPQFISPFLKRVDDIRLFE
jgi:hypothetical protein